MADLGFVNGGDQVPKPRGSRRRGGGVWRGGFPLFEFDALKWHILMHSDT